MNTRLCKALLELSSRRISLNKERWPRGLMYGIRSISQSQAGDMANSKDGSKDLKVAESENSVQEPKMSAPSPGVEPTDFTPKVNPSTLDRFILAWANVYPRMEEVPDRVRTTQLMHARDICRVKVAHWMTGILVLLIAIQIIHGRQEREARWAVYEAETEAAYQEEIRKHEEATRNK